jgi:hypothetical protein
VVEVADVRRRFRQRIQDARREAETRRVGVDRAARDYEMFLRDTATPAFRMVASVLSAEGYPFKVYTPADSLRLSSTNARDDYFELELDTDAVPPLVMGRVNRNRGGRLVTIERPIRPDASIADLTQEDVVEFVLSEFDRFV